MQPAEPIPVKLFVGVLFSEAVLISLTQASLEQAFGKVDYKSPEYEFNFSDYYESEMGSPIRRIFFSFSKLIDPGELSNIKIRTNKIEDELAVAGKRKINLDPGYMDYNKIVLASAKYNAQKVYLADGIYADPTLWYEKGKFHAYSSAFPDFKSQRYEKTFFQIRTLYKAAYKVGD